MTMERRYQLSSHGTRDEVNPPEPLGDEFTWSHWSVMDITASVASIPMLDCSRTTIHVLWACQKLQP